LPQVNNQLPCHQLALAKMYYSLGIYITCSQKIVHVSWKCQSWQCINFIYVAHL